MGYSKKWKNRRAILDPKTCKELHGKIYAIAEEPNPEPPIHPNGRCEIVRLETILAGHATKDNINGIDWYIKYHGRIPDNYITREEALSKGWNGNKKLSSVAPDKILFGGVYRNVNEKLPDEYGRIWYEADIDYTGSRRNSSRIVFSNDGLIFVTHDHYETFVEVE